MSGHSKWATTKHQKGAKDQARAKLFAKLIRQVEVAAREGGGDMTANATLRTMFQKARDSSVPIDTIERAVKRGTGELEGVRYEPVSYEGYGAGGVAVIVECLTDNRNRTGAEIRSLFSRNGGSMAEPGAVAWQFDRKGVVEVPRELAEDDVMAVGIEAGAEDIVDGSESWVLTCSPHDLATLRGALEQADMKPTNAELQLLASTAVEVADTAGAQKVLHLVELLEDHDDVQNVYSNVEIPSEVGAALTSS